MTDGARAYPTVIKDLTPSAQHQLCIWHQTQLMDNFAKKWANDGAVATDMIVDAIREPDMSKAETKWIDTMVKQFNSSPRLTNELPCQGETVATTQKREAANKKRQNSRTLLQVWYNKRHKFWRAVTKLLMNIGSVSSQGGEVMNHAIKSTDTALTLTQLIEKTKHVSERHFFVQLQAIDRARNTVKLQRGVDNWTETLQSELSIFAVELLTQQLALSHKNEWRPVTGSQPISASAVTVTSLSRSCRNIPVHSVVRAVASSYTIYQPFVITGSISCFHS